MLAHPERVRRHYGQDFEVGSLVRWTHAPDLLFIVRNPPSVMFTFKGTRACNDVLIQEVGGLEIKRLAGHYELSHATDTRHRP